MRRPFLVSNRLPVRILVRDDGSVDVAPAAGGVATALREVQLDRGAPWLGWPGGVASGREDEVTAALAKLGALPVFLSAEEMRGFYEGFSTSVLWPLLHTNLDKLPLGAERDFRVYVDVNRRFADHILAHADPGDLIWVHDFQLALVPGELRRRVPDAAIGFFLHTPFPAEDLFRVLPWRKELLAGILAADLVGLHTASYAEHLKSAARTLLGARVDGNRVSFAGHCATLTVAPISVDVERFERAARDPSVAARTQALKEEARGRTILLGVDRLDYTKGIPARLVAVERLLDRWPELKDQVHFIQVAVPTREHVDAYADFRKEINELVGRINGKHGTTLGVPIHFLYREVPFEELVALYCAADVMVVTPFRDGMNLVCKEYIAARADEQGVLVLSELAGAADELEGAVLVNPYDVEGMAARMRLAMRMPPDEQRVRMAGMRRALRGADVKKWARDFLADLEHAASARGRGEALADDLWRAVRADELDVVLDYDGTLVALEATPSQAAPDDELRALLGELAACPDTRVHVVSGRDAATMEAWLGDLPVFLHAEHGAQHRPPGGAWTPGPTAPWKDDARHALDVVAAQAPGSFVEEKPASPTLHVRCVPRESRDNIAHGAALVLERARPKNDGLAVVVGDCVVEARVAGVNESAIAATLSPGSVVVAAGHEASDDELFGALRGDAVTIAVGDASKRARHRMRAPVELRTLLRRLAGARAKEQLSRRG